MTGQYARGGKRLLDIIGAGASLIALAPVMAAVALAIKLLDPGPVIFRQVRVGRNNMRFDFYKFRSMPMNTGDIPSDRIADIRLSAVGRFIRRTNVDELPQLWNVLRGDMSLIGPRPALPSQDELLAAREANGAVSLRPGLTGLAQVNSFDGMPVTTKADLDGSYASALSLANDVKIVVRTFGYLAKPPPKY